MPLDDDYYQCPHTRLSGPRTRVIRNGSIQYRRQCLDCGQAIGNMIPKAIATLEAEGSFDESLFEEKKRESMERQKAKWQDEREGWWDWYSHYLESDAWKIRRRKVLQRCNGICEGCHEAPVAEVHHLTYENVGQELLYQLVGLCDNCHQIAHLENPLAGQRKQIQRNEMLERSIYGEDKR